MSVVPGCDEVPVVDLSRDPVVVARELDVICREVGFLQIVGHGVDRQTSDAAWDAAAAFFALPVEHRLAVTAPRAGYPFGYFPMAGETLARSLDQVSRPDLKQTFNVGPVDAPTHRFSDEDEASIYSPNLWPDDTLPELRATWTVYYREMAALCSRILSVMAIGLWLPPDHFEPCIDRHGSSLRANHYPHQDDSPPAGQLRAGAHTDYGTVTVLRQDDAPGGLEVESIDGRWVGVPAIDGAYVVNVGDLLARWTNDRWRSTMHRVVNPPARHRGTTNDPNSRQSMPYFHNANWDCVVRALPTCLAPGEAARYAPVLAGPHLMAKFRQTVTPSS